MSNSKRNGQVEVDRLPPYSEAAEKAVLGCVLLSARECLPLCIERLRENGAEFYDPRHRTCYETMLELYDDEAPVDIVTLVERLSLWGRLDEAGGLAYLSVLPEAAPSSASLAYYLGIVEEKAQLRRLVQVCTGAVGRIYDQTGDVPQFLEEVEREVLRTAEARTTRGTPPINELVSDALALMEQSGRSGGVLSGLATGFADLDKLSGGLQDGSMIVIAGRPGLGKTSLSMNIVERVSVDNRLPVAVFSLEMTADQLVRRLICSRARVNLRNVRDGFMADADMPKISLAAGRISSAPLYIQDERALSIMQLRAKARRLWQQYGIKLLVVDYLQLVRGGGQRRQENRQQEVSDVSSGLQALAGELKIPLIVLSQLNRQVERDKDRKPRLSDLYESGRIEADGDLVAFLYRPRKEDENETKDENYIPVSLYVAKHRHGSTGEIDLTFLKPYTRFESAAKVADEDMPEQRQFGPD